MNNKMMVDGLNFETWVIEQTDFISRDLSRTYELLRKYSGDIEEEFLNVSVEEFNEIKNNISLVLKRQLRLQFVMNGKKPSEADYYHGGLEGYLRMVEDHDLKVHLSTKSNKRKAEEDFLIWAKIKEQMSDIRNNRTFIYEQSKKLQLDMSNYKLFMDKLESLTQGEITRDEFRSKTHNLVNIILNDLREY